MTTKVFIPDLTAGGSAISWVSLVEDTDFNDQPASTSTITMVTDQTANIKPGYAIKFVGSGTTYYAICTAIVANLLTIAGAPLTASDAWLTGVSYCGPEKTSQMIISIPTLYDDAASTTLLESDLKIKGGIIWKRSAAYLVHFSIINVTNDGGGTKPCVNVTIAGNAVSTSNTNTGLTANTSLVNTVVDINTSNYPIVYGNAIEVITTQGTNGDAANLAVFITFVFA